MFFSEQLRTRQGCEYLVQYDTDSIILDWHKVIMDAIQQLVNSFISCSYPVHILFISFSYPVHFLFISCSYPVHILFISNRVEPDKLSLSIIVIIILIINSIRVCIGHICRNRSVFLKKKMRRERKGSGPVCMSVCLSVGLFYDSVCVSVCLSL